MSWIPFAVAFAAAAGYMFLKRSGQVSTKEAIDFLRNGARVIDVRNPDEFESGHILQAYNMPLDRIEMIAPSTVKDRTTVLLLHCSTGVRSRLAKKRLEDIGYKNVFNLGSYDRAGRIVMGQ